MRKLSRRGRMKRTLTLVLLASAATAGDAAAAGVLDRVADIYRGGDPSRPAQLADAGGELYFGADSATTGVEIYRSDGTRGGTKLVKDIWPGPGGSSPSAFTKVGSTVFFFAVSPGYGSELWKTDGSAKGTTLVKDFLPGHEGGVGGTLTSYKGALYFTAHDASGDYELWKVDGNSAPERVKDINPLGPAVPSHLTVVGDTLFFTADDGVTGTELWKTDGTSTGTQLVADISPGTADTLFQFYSLTSHGGKLFFVASPGGLNDDPEVWSSDGTAVGTQRVKDIREGGGSAPRQLTSSGPYLYFTADDGSEPGRQLWRTDGTEASTVSLTTEDVGFDVESIIDVAGTLFFIGGSTWESQHPFLWKTDGTPESTVPVKVMRVADFDLTHSAAAVGGKLHFSGCEGGLRIEENGTSLGDEGTGCELWESDGTEAGTVMIADIYEGSFSNEVFIEDHGTSFTEWGANSSKPQEMTAVGNRLFFTAEDADAGRELWTYLPCAAGVAASGKKCN